MVCAHKKYTRVQKEMTKAIDENLIRGFIFACTNKSEAECLNGPVFATEKFYGPIVIRIRKGDLLFLNNIDTDTLYGVFKAVSNGRLNTKKDAFDGKYPYQLRVKPIGKTIALAKANKVLRNFDFKRNIPLFRQKLASFLEVFIAATKQLPLTADSQENPSNKLIKRQVDRILESKAEVDIEKEIPLIESTTFWDFPTQSYGLKSKGNNKYAGVTPALIIYNMIWRYTDPGDLVVDPMCGSGTTIDVCKEEKRKVIGYDIIQTRPDIIQNDARKIPLKDNSVDMIFVDSPYGDNIKYSEHHDDIGHISSESVEFYDELEKVIRESHRILKNGKVIGWLIGDQWVRGRFTPVGFTIYDRLCKYFEPVEVICVARRSQYSNTGMWHNRARRFNFYLRGFKYLIIVRKTGQESYALKPRKIKWAYYQRGRGI